MTCCTPAPLPVAVIGAGPVGLAAAAHLLARGLRPLLIEGANTVGAAPRDWGHVRMFSPWRYNIDRAAAALLEAAGWQAPDPEAYPTGSDLVDRYLAPLAALPAIAACLRLGSEVTAITRVGHDKLRSAGRQEAPFELRLSTAAGAQRLLARAVIDASGTWHQPAPAGADGLPALGEAACAARIRYGMPDILGADRARYAGRRVMVVGSGASAAGSLLALAELARQTPGTTPLWAVRSASLTRALGGGEADQLPERGALGTGLRGLLASGAVELVQPFAIADITPQGDTLLVAGLHDGKPHAVAVDELVVATGLRPALGLLAELRTDLDPALECPRALAPLIDPNVHSCGTVRPHGAAELAQPDAGLFIAGMKSYGRAPTFLLATGHEQVRSIAAWIAGDREAALRVELELPETGVCSGDPAAPEASRCAPAPAATASCCARTPEPAGAK
jgi:NADPH-dependent 2,4-dienoyl-CoA reductase/sulfur reductase-like enzyme